MFDRFTDRARKVMNLAKSEAQRLNHDYLGNEHILLGLVQEGSGVAANVLRNMGIDLKRIRAAVEESVKASATIPPLGNLPFTPRGKKVLELSLEEASQLGHNYIGTEHLLLGLIKEEEASGGGVLSHLGVRLEDVREEVLEFLGAPQGEETPESPDDADVVDDHPLVRRLVATIAHYSMLRESAITSQDWERAAYMRDLEYRLKSQLEVLRQQVAEDRDFGLRSSDRIERYGSLVEWPGGTPLRGAELAQLVRLLAARRSVLIVSQHGSGRATLVGFAARELALQAGRSSIHLIQPNHAALRGGAEDSDYAEALLEFVTDLAKHDEYTLVVPHVELCCSALPDEVIDAWRRALAYCVQEDVSVVAWTTPEGQEEFMRRWPGIAGRCEILRLVPMDEARVVTVVRERLAESDIMSCFRCSDDFVEHLMSRQRARHGVETLGEPRSTLALLDSALEIASRLPWDESAQVLLTHPDYSALERRAKQALARHAWGELAQLAMRLEKLRMKLGGALAANARVLEQRHIDLALQEDT